MFTRVWSWFKSLFTRDHSRPERKPQDTEPTNNEPDQNDSEIDLWYPDRIKNTRIESLRMRTRGKYKDGFPTGAVVHYTAGRSRDESKCGRGRPHLEQGIRGVQSAVDKGSFAYFIIDRDGNVFQNFPLNEWGYHAGSSSYFGINGTVSDELVGIEVQNAGKLEKVATKLYKAWFTAVSKGDGYFKEDEVRYTKGEENQHRGYYHKYSDAQEKSLVDLLKWMNDEGRGIFQYDFVLGHDEVAPARKSDPGASLSMTMPEFRKLLKSK